MGRRFLAARLFIFDLAMCGMTVLGALYFSQMARNEFPPDFDFFVLPLQARALIARMARGQLPFPSLVTALTPVLLTSAGLSPRIAKTATLIHAAILLSTIIAIFPKTKSVSCVLDGTTENVCMVNFVQDISSAVLVLSLAVFSCIPSAESTHDFLKLLRDARNADSV
jgi:hypothetical protein